MLLTIGVLLVALSAPGLHAFAEAQRSAAAVAAFRREHPCPATGKTTGACHGYVVDHLMPLCWGGADEPDNMSWQTKADSLKKDEFEREACQLKRTQKCR